jgi:purine-binding chemotaxis protein CheW
VTRFPRTPADGATWRSLRDEFDAAFAAPPPAGRLDLVALLAIRVGTESMAVRVMEIAGLIATRKIVSIPSRRPELLGITGLRGAVLPVFSLARLLGIPDAGPAPRWLALAGVEEPVALAFLELESHVVVSTADLRPASSGALAHVREVVVLQGQTRPVLGVTSLVRSITGR